MTTQGSFTLESPGASVRPVNGTGTGKVKGWSSRGGIETRCRVPKWQMPAFFVFLGEMLV